MRTGEVQGKTTARHTSSDFVDFLWEVVAAKPSTDAFDWAHTRRAWYFQAFARDPEASVFYIKAPPFLVYAGELARHFPNTKAFVHGAQPLRGVRGHLPEPPGVGGAGPGPRPRRPRATPTTSERQ